MAEIHWFPAERMHLTDGPGFSWVGQTPRRFQQVYWRTFKDERYAQVDLTPGKWPTPELRNEMRSLLPSQEGPDVPPDALI